MKRIVWMAVALLGAGITVHAQTSAKDSMRVVNLQEVQVVSTRATAKTPVAFTNIGKAELKKVNFGQDIPYLLSMTPSTLTTSDAGAGIGYTTLRVRGTDGTRINITVNGIPMNDAESFHDSVPVLGEYARLFFFRKRYAGAARSRYIDERSRCFRSQCQYANRRCIYETIRRIQWFIRFVQHAQGNSESGNRPTH